MDREENQDTLKGKTIICTYPKKNQDILSDTLKQLGAIVLSMPMINISSLPFSLKNDIRYYNWIVFTSKNAIPFFFDKVKPVAKNKIAVIGQSTANELVKYDLKADFIGSGKSGIDFAEEFSVISNTENNILLVQGSLAPGTLLAKLSLENSVERIDVYKTTKPTEIDDRLLKIIVEDLYDVIIISSPSAIINLHSVLKGNKTDLRLISIGKTTTEAIRELGIVPVAEASESSYKGLADITIEYLKENK